MFERILNTTERYLFEFIQQRQDRQTTWEVTIARSLTSVYIPRRALNNLANQFNFERQYLGEFFCSSSE